MLYISITKNWRKRQKFVIESCENNGDKTIYNYLGHLQDSFLIERARRFDVRGKKFIDTPQKYYFTDLGIRNSFLDFRQSEEISHTMENVIYLELRRRGFNVDVGTVEIRVGNVKKTVRNWFRSN